MKSKTRKAAGKASLDPLVRRLARMWCNLNSWNNPITGKPDPDWTREKIEGAMRVIQTVVPERTLLRVWNEPNKEVSVER